SLSALHRYSSVVVYYSFPRPSPSTLFPYTTLFRSHAGDKNLLVRPLDRFGAVENRVWRHGVDNQACRLQFQKTSKITDVPVDRQDRKSTRLNSSHLVISYAVFCLKKKKTREKSSDYSSPRPLSRRASPTFGWRRTRSVRGCRSRPPEPPVSARRVTSTAPGLILPV